MGKTLWLFGVHALALVGALAVALVTGIGLVAGDLFGGNDLPVVQARQASPGGALEALQVRGSGGGAAGWCREFVVVRDNGQAGEPYEPGGDDVVFSTKCGSKFTLRWATSRQLVVRYQLPPGQLGGFELRPSDKAGRFQTRLEPET